MRSQSALLRLLIALSVLTWTVAGVVSSAHATTEAIAHAGESSEWVVVLDHSANETPIDTSGPGADHDHEGHPACGPCHGHAMRSSAEPSLYPLADAIVLRPSSASRCSSTAPHGLFRPPRV